MLGAGFPCWISLFLKLTYPDSDLLLGNLIHGTPAQTGEQGKRVTEQCLFLERQQGQTDRWIAGCQTALHLPGKVMGSVPKAHMRTEPQQLFSHLKQTWQDSFSWKSLLALFGDQGEGGVVVQSKRSLVLHA
jgi:hypothetical protein